MKKILISILIILLIILAYFAIFRGISIGNFHILSVQQISEENDKLTQEIAQTELLMYTDYPSKKDELDQSVSSLLTAKDEYHDLASVSTEGELTAANQEETYTIAYLWTRLGRHATAEGVVAKFEIVTGSTGEPDVKNIQFTITGEYPQIILFVEDIEDDSELGFRIENFKLVPSGEDLQATFTVRNVRIEQESLTSATSTQSTINTNTDTDTNTDIDPNTITNTQTDTTTNSAS